MTTTSPNLRGQPSAGPGLAWRGGGPLVLTFSFAEDGADAVGNLLPGGAWAPFSTVQRTAARQALEAWATISGLSFLEVPDLPGGAGIDLRFRLEDLGGVGVLGRAWGPGEGGIALSLGLFLADSLAPHATRVGHATLLHEIGHAVGLEHPEAVGATRDLSVMSTTPGRLPLPTAPRPADAEAAAALYGTEAAEAALGQRWSWDAAHGAARGLGTEGDDRMVGTDLVDRLVGGAGDDTLLGGAGADTLVTGFARADVPLDLGAGTLAAPDGTDRFAGIEAIEFTDGRLVLDADAAAARMLRLYRVVLDRLPDDAGLAHWTYALERGLPLEEVAEAFLRSREFALRFGGGGGSTDDAALARLLAGNLHAPDLAAGIVDALAESGATRAEVVAEFSEGWAARRATVADLAGGVWDMHESAGEIAMLYHLALGRSPDAPGWTRWTVALAEGLETESVASALLHTREFRAALHDGGGTPEPAALVPLLLERALGRAPSAAEAAPWLAAVAEGGMDGPELLLAMAADEALTARFVPVVQDGMLFA